ncbi:MAG: adenosylmethionine--8-amino-7-oxononanoate transaminase [Bacteroidia bacterium]|nr:adenosylmethionine--8-amino-7-oxononanoate transaminase [Bacteroidia bacterium]MDW8236623.1 adenosylmethionine--8-amino-7-oxononanoate transaminase [Bacteroidia bacterium]
MPVWRPYTSHWEGMPPTLPIVRATGSYLYTADGRAIWDGTCAWWVTVHGHCHPFIAQAIAEQAHTLDQVLFADFTHSPAEALVEKLSHHTGLSWGFFSDDGSTAVEVALKIALQYFHNRGEPRRKFLALEGAYHGDTFGAMSVSARSAFTSPFQELLFEVEWLPFPSHENEGKLWESLESLQGRTDIAGFIGEPIVQGVAGMRMYEASYWDAIARAVRRIGGLIIADEVFTGFGRTGTLFATDACNEKPDILCLSKGLTGGFLPLGLTLVRQEVFEAFYSSEPAHALYHGHSYTANPLACAAALANLSLWERPETWEKYHLLVEMQRTLAAQWQTLYPETPVRQKGLIWAVELPSPEKGYFAPHRHLFKKYALERNIFLRPLGTVIYILPALSSTPDELIKAVGVVESYLKEVAAAPSL